MYVHSTLFQDCLLHPLPPPHPTALSDPAYKSPHQVGFRDDPQIINSDKLEKLTKRHIAHQPHKLRIAALQAAAQQRQLRRSNPQLGHQVSTNLVEITCRAATL